MAKKSEPTEEELFVRSIAGHQAKYRGLSGSLRGVVHELVCTCDESFTILSSELKKLKVNPDHYLYTLLSRHQASFVLGANIKIDA